MCLVLGARLVVFFEQPRLVRQQRLKFKNVLRVFEAKIVQSEKFPGLAPRRVILLPLLL